MAKVKPAFATTIPVVRLSGATGKAYRLLSDSGREYVARAGTTTPFHTGETIWLLAADLPAGARMRLFGKGEGGFGGVCRGYRRCRGPGAARDRTHRRSGAAIWNPSAAAIARCFRSSVTNHIPLGRRAT